MTYGKINTTNYKNKPENSICFSSHENPAIIILVTPVATGTESQQAYATNIKAEAMSSVDKTAGMLLANPRLAAGKDASVREWRNSLMAAVDAETDAIKIINTLKDISRDAQRLAINYNILPK